MTKLFFIYVQEACGFLWSMAKNAINYFNKDDSILPNIPNLLRLNGFEAEENVFLSGHCYLYAWLRVSLLKS